MSISFSGLASGLDTESIIEQLMELERQPVTLLEQKQYKLESKVDVVQTANNSLLSLKNSLKNFLTDYTLQNDFNLSDESILTGSVDASAAEGEFDVLVNFLATVTSRTTAQQASGWTATGGAVTITTETDEGGAGDVFNVTINAGDDFTDIIQTLNATTSVGGAAFSDYFDVYELKDADDNSTLLMKSTRTGVDSDFTTGGWTAALGGAGGFTGYTAGTDAEIEINGATITSDTNVFEDVMTGVTFVAQDTSATAVKVTIGLDTESVVEDVASFISNFNSVTNLFDNYLTEEPVTDPETEEELLQGLLYGDYDISEAKYGIRTKTTGYMDTTGLAYSLLSELGITSEASSGSYVSNNIELDEDKLTTALEANKEDAMDLLENWATQLDDYLDGLTKVSVVESDAGSFYRKILSLEDQIELVEDDIDDWEERLESIENSMREEWTQMETLLAELQNTSSYLTTQLAALTGTSSSD